VKQLLPWRILLWIMAVCLIPAGVAAQNYFVRHFNNEGGLPANTIKGLAWEPSTGLAWIATEAGVVRWDGYRFSASGLDEGRIYRMGEFPKGYKPGIMVLGDRYQAFRISGGKMEALDDSASKALSEQLSGLSDTSSLERICSVFLRHPLLPTWMCATDTNRTEVLINYLGNLYLKSPSGIKKLRSVSNNVSFFSQEGRTFMFDNQSILVYDHSRQRMQPLLPQGLPTAEPLHFLTDTDTPYPILSSQGHLYAIRVRADSVSAYPLPYVLPQSATPSVFRQIAHSGQVLIGDRYNGLYLLSPSGLRQQGDPAQRAGAGLLVTYGQALLPDGRILNSNGVVFGHDGASAVVQRPFAGTVHLFRAGRYLYSSQPIHNRLYRRDLENGKSELLQTLDSARWLTFLHVRDTLFVLGRQQLYFLEGKRLRVLRRFSGPLAHPDQLGAVELTPGVTVIPHGTHIRFVHVRQGRVDDLRITKKAQVRYVLFDSGTLFIGTYGEGLLALKNGKLRALPLDKARHLRFAHALAPDGNGFFYISTNNGLFRVSRKALHTAADASIPVYYHYLGKQDGLQSTELNGGCIPAWLRLPDGSFSFPSIQGPVRFHPDSLQLSPPGGQLLHMGLSADGHLQERDNPLLPAEVQVVAIDLLLPHWGAPENQYLWYRLLSPDDKSDTSWIAFTPGQLPFRFSSLRPGNYALQVRTFSGFDPGQLQQLSVSFRVQPPWYLRPPAWVLAVLLLTGLIASLLASRTARIRARNRRLELQVAERTAQLQENYQTMQHQLRLVSEANQLKERLIGIISHNIITPLRYIHQATTMMRENARALNPALREKAVDSINDTSLELELLSINLLNWIKLQHQQVQVRPEEFEPYEVCQHVEALLRPIAQKRDINIRTQAMEMIVYQYRDALQVVVYNLVLNAVLHSGGSVVTIECRLSDSKVILDVSDDGRGIPADKRSRLLDSDGATAPPETENQGKGFGFLLVRDLLRLMQGNLHFTFEKGEGTHISIVFPQRLSRRNND